VIVVSGRLSVRPGGWDTSRRAGRTPVTAVALTAGTAATVAWPTAAAAHVGGGAFILLLPTHLYVAGGAIVVAVSFALVTLVPARWFARLERLGRRWRVPGLPWRDAASTVASLGSLAVILALALAGILGSRDPLANPLPLFVWIVWWVGFTYLHALCGNLWAHLNPWIGLYRVLTMTGRLRRRRERPPFRYPAWTDHWPAVGGFLAFAWLELIYPAPADPAVLASLVVSYLLWHFAGVLAFGERWLQAAEPFSVYFGMVSRLAPLETRVRSSGGSASDGRLEVEVTLPSLRLLRTESLSVSLAVFVLLVLASVSFDGLSRTFAWLGRLGVNPLAYPGRTALMVPNTLGFLGLFAGLVLTYLAAVRLQALLAGGRHPAPQLVALFAVPLVPIACGYHFAHYLPVFLVDVQHALRAASDPFGRGWDLLGTRDLPVVTSFLSDPARVYAIWHSQVVLIVAAHVAGVVLAHVLALRLAGPARATVSQLPMLVLMIGFTVLGLWLLSTPAVG
jgi:hypothetical protein